MYLEEVNTSFITINNSEGAFIDILDEFPEEIKESLSELGLDITVKDIFPTSISLVLEGYKYDIIEGIGQITQLLILSNIFNFSLTLHTVEQLED